MGERTIFVVEDDDDTLEYVGDLLTSHAYQTVLISEPSRAYTMIKAQKPDLVILDLQMHGDPVAGLNILDQLRADAEIAHVPVLLYSATLHQLYETRSNSRPDATLEKPFMPQQLLGKIQALLATLATVLLYTMLLDTLLWSIL